MIRKSLLFTVLLCTFLSVSVNFLYAATTPSFSTNYDGNPPIVAGQDVTFTNTSTTDGTVEWIAWDFNSDSTVDAMGSPAVYAFPSAGQITVTMWIKVDNEDFPLPVAIQFDVEPWALFFRAVGFESTVDGKWHEIYRDIDQTVYTDDPFSNYQWWDKTLLGPDQIPNGTATDKKGVPNLTQQPADDQNFPMCFTSGATMNACVMLQGIGAVPNVKIRGINSAHGYDFQETNGIAIAFDATEEMYFAELECDQAFTADKVDCYEALTIAWEISVNNGAWEPFQTTTHDTYVTWMDPYTNLNKLFHTLVHVACKNADEQTSEAMITATIWSEFTDQKVYRKEDGSLLKYYGDWDTDNTFTWELLKDADGQCRSWAYFFVDCLKVHDIHSSNNIAYIYANDGSDGFLINNWSFAASPISFVNNYPYSNIKLQNDDLTEKNNWLYQDVTDETGLAGQGETNNDPMSFFCCHYMALISSTYYDPSYGLTHSGNLDNFESQAICGYYKEEEHSVFEGPKAQGGVDTCLNPEDEDPNFDKLDTLDVDVWGIKQNPAGNQIASFPLNW